MHIWIDLANSPQVLFFRPIINELTSRGFEIEITARSYAQTIELTNEYGLSHTAIGRHGGSGLASLMFQISIRAFMLAKWAYSRQFDLAVSHNSYSHIVASSLLKIPSVTLMDYEHQPLNHLAFRLAKRVIVPEVFPDSCLKMYGAGQKAKTYPGIKEQIYLADFTPLKDYRAKQGFPEDQLLVIVRPPATWTAYHRFENKVFDELLDTLASVPGLFILFLPRTLLQAESVNNLTGINVAKHAYDGPNLLYCADLVISGGGTMNRESAVLGTPTYTIFKGKLSAVDKLLIDSGRMNHIGKLEEMEAIEIGKKPKNSKNIAQVSLLHLVTDKILDSYLDADRVLKESP